MKRYQVNIIGTDLSVRFDDVAKAIRFCRDYKMRAMVFDLSARMIVFRNW